VSEARWGAACRAPYKTRSTGRSACATNDSRGVLRCFSSGSSFGKIPNGIFRVSSYVVEVGDDRRERLAAGNHHLVVVVVDVDVHSFLRGLLDLLRSLFNVKTKVRVHQVHRRGHEER
jgi:hypothetical protein